jgi:GNAT superfamily N-acetyltransferase
MTAPVQSTEIRVRPARAADIPELARLAAELGYPSTENEIRARLAAIESTPGHGLWVAEATGANGKLAGFLNAYVKRAIDTDARVEIAALVVDATQRSRGVGKLLIDRAEAWARENGCCTIGLRSNVIRDRAHKFYERLGFEHYKTQKAFRKSL